MKVADFFRGLHYIENMTLSDWLVFIGVCAAISIVLWKYGHLLRGKSKDA